MPKRQRSNSVKDLIRGSNRCHSPPRWSSESGQRLQYARNELYLFFHLTNLNLGAVSGTLCASLAKLKFFRPRFTDYPLKLSSRVSVSRQSYSFLLVYLPWIFAVDLGRSFAMWSSQALQRFVGGFLARLLSSCLSMLRFATPNRIEAPVHPLKTQNIDIEAITAKYKAERAKRLREEGVAQFKQAKGSYSQFKEDFGATPIIRDAVTAETKVLIVGAGIGGIVAAVKLKQQGIDDLVILDKAAGFGGTWYWNQYPGNYVLSRNL